MPANKHRFSHAWIEKLPTPTSRQEWSDTESRGLFLRLGPTGRPTFYFFARVHGRLTRIRLGTFPDMPLAKARTEVARIRGEVAIGQQPQSRSKQAREEITLAELFEWYIRTHAKPHKRTWQADERRYNRVLSRWADRRLSTITTQAVKDLHVKIGAAEGPYAGNKMLELLGFAWRLGAAQLGFATPDPTQGIKRFPKHERERYLTKAEIPAFFAAVAGLQREATRDFILIALYTGARRSNVAAMHWQQLDLAEGIWIVPAAESKNARPMRIVLPTPAIEILKRREAAAVGRWVFPGPGKTGHYCETKGAMERIRQLMAVELGVAPETIDLRLHDLRRTLGSWQAAQGTSLHVIGKTLGHQSTQSTKIYARLADDPIRESVEAATAAMIATPKKPEK